MVQYIFPAFFRITQGVYRYFIYYELDDMQSDISNA